MNEILPYPSAVGVIPFESFMLDENQEYNKEKDASGRRLSTRDRKKTQDAQTNSKIIVRGKKMATFSQGNGITREFLRGLEEKRQALVAEIPNKFFSTSGVAIDLIAYTTALSKIKRYFDCLYILCKVMENNRNRYHTNGTIPIYKWKASKGDMVENTCWRFELIMTAHLYAMWLFNYGVVCEDVKKSHKLIMDAYCMLRHVCKEEVSNWYLRDELYLPFECTESGINIYISLCMIKLQTHVVRLLSYDISELSYGITKSEDITVESFLTDVGINGLLYEDYDAMVSGSHEIKVQLALWIFHESKELQQLVYRRLKDGRCDYLEVWARDILTRQNIEALCLSLYWNSHICRDDLLLKRARKIVEFAETSVQQTMTRFNVKAYNRDNGPVSVNDVLGLLSLLGNMIKKQKEDLDRMKSNLVSPDKGDVLDDKQPIWDILPVNAIKFYREVLAPESGMDKVNIDLQGMQDILTKILCTRTEDLSSFLIQAPKE